jgi:hypothetical protein
MKNADTKRQILYYVRYDTVVKVTETESRTEATRGWGYSKVELLFSGYRVSV